MMNGAIAIQPFFISIINDEQNTIFILLFMGISEVGPRRTP